MKKIKFIYTLLFMFMLSSGVSAQFKIKKNINGEFLAGMTGASLDFVDNNEYNKLKIGFQLGFLFNYNVIADLQLQSGFILKKKGGLKHYKYSYIDDKNINYSRDTKLTVDANYMYIPINIGYQIALSKSFDLGIYGGVYGAYGFKGYIKQEGTLYSITNKTTSSENVSSTDIFTNSIFNRWDYGLNGSITLYYGNYLMKFEYEYGLANIATDRFLESNSYDLNPSKVKTLDMGISLGFRF